MRKLPTKLKQLLRSPLAVAVLLLSAAALAQSGGATVQNEVNKLIHDGISWFQRIAAMMMIGGSSWRGASFSATSTPTKLGAP